MKLTKVLGLSLVAVAAMLTSCASKDVKGTGFDVNVNKPVIVDYKGQSFGADIPGWVIDAADGNKKNVAKGLNLSGSKIWVLSNDGKDLDMLKLWTDQIDGRAEIASSIEQSVADLITANFAASEDEKEKAVKEFSMRMSNITLNGLEKEADYWTKTRTLKTGVKKAKSDSDYTEKYTYLVVFSMDMKLWEKQIKAAMDDIDENDDQSIMLRDMITSKLMDELELYVTAE